MRIWDYRLLPYLPDLQFKGQLRELVAIMHDWRDKGKTNHLLINRVMKYPKNELLRYFLVYEIEYHKRYNRWLTKYWDTIKDFTQDNNSSKGQLYHGWHDNGYLRVCMANLYEKHKYAIGKSRISNEEWKTLANGYKAITGKEYKV